MEFLEMTTHTFQPTLYHNTLGPHEPVLAIQPGDRVETTTVDAHGLDASGAQAAGTPNPQTGPFFIEGAEPGDTLVVRLERIWPNRPYGWTSTSLAENVVDPRYVNDLYRHPTGAPWPIFWDIDLSAGTATLREPVAKLGRISLPLDPMLGCFGVAPRGGQSISTATSAEHGGNMDYRGFRSGAAVYLPVFVPGALFCVGDGHAVQGDGEIAGTGIEVSMEVAFRVDLVKQKSIGWPRGENETHIFTVGNARPLDQALQHATTEMARWLQSDYGLDAFGAGLLMGQAVEYEVGNVYDPAYTMVCKMRKDLISQA
jgi:amidase